MKTRTTYAILLLAVLSRFPVVSQTITFAPGQVTVSQGDAITAEYPGARQIAIGPQFTLSARPLLIPLEDSQSIGDLSSASALSVDMGIVVPFNQINDATTSSENTYTEVEHEHNSTERLGAHVVEVIGEVVLRGRRYADVLVFPVTADTCGRLWFHPDVDLTLAGRAVSEPELLSRDIVIEQARQTAAPGALSGEGDYLIVTSSRLADAMHPLAKYKNETGYRTTVELIETILARHSGRDDAERLRERLKEFYATGGRYVLLAGDETILPIRYAYHATVYTPPTLDQLQICDLYFADLTGDWDADNDGIWGEKYTDGVDLEPELLVGRLPINTPEEAANYIGKLIRYETNPGSGDRTYLTRSFFFSSDQMRDYGEGGQHRTISQAYPGWFQIDTVSAVELANGSDLNPTNFSPAELTPIITNGFGIINVIAHGRSDGFVLKSSGYNEWPKSYLLTYPAGTEHGELEALAVEGKPCFYYSLACNNGGFDMDQPPLNQTNPCMGQQLLAGSGGAVGMVGYSRWGWISSSYLLQTAFFDSLFAHPDRTAVEAMYASKAALYFYRDLVYGQNYLGDPTLRIYTRLPEKPTINVAAVQSGLLAAVNVDGTGMAGCRLILSANGVVLSEFTTDESGKTVVNCPVQSSNVYRLTAIPEGGCITQGDFIPALVTGVDEDDRGTLIPEHFSLLQNYPNPFNPSTTIAFDLPRAEDVRLVVCNLLGQIVTVLVDGRLPAASHQVVWNGDDQSGSPVASGVYFYRLTTASGTAIKKMILMK